MQKFSCQFLLLTGNLFICRDFVTNVTFVVAKLKKKFLSTLSAAVFSPVKALCTFLSISLSEEKENPEEVSSKFYCNSVVDRLECLTERSLLGVNEFDQL